MMKNILSKEEINEIHDLCNQYKIENYTINSDGSIDVNGDVDLTGNGLSIIPIRFNKVSGNFYCYNNKLTSLEGSPKEVGGHFNCISNQLTSLEGSPKSVGGNFYCNYNNKLTSLEGSPKQVGGDFVCNDNFLTSLKGCPKEVGGYFYYHVNKLPDHFTKLYYELNQEEIKIFFKYQNDLRIWDDGYDQGAAQDLFDEIKDGLL